MIDCGTRSSQSSPQRCLAASTVSSPCFVKRRRFLSSLAFKEGFSRSSIRAGAGSFSVFYCKFRDLFRRYGSAAAIDFFQYGNGTDFAHRCADGFVFRGGFQYLNQICDGCWILFNSSITFCINSSFRCKIRLTSFITIS